jgi:hypothetical protein
MATRRYAEGTTVDATQSRGEIERAVERHGAVGFAYATQGRNAIVAFQAHGRQIRFALELPDPQSPEFWLTETGRDRTDSAAREAYRKEVRRRWRSLALVIKAKLTAVEDGVVEFETEFLAHTVMPDGRTVADHARPVVEHALATGEVRPMLPALERARDAP